MRKEYSVEVVLHPVTDSFTKDNLNIIAKPPTIGGASHDYLVLDRADDGLLLDLHFQEGPRQEVGINGVLEGTLLQIILDRQKAFQAGPFACRENALVITKLEEALLWLKARELDREQRRVLGTTKN